LSSLDNWNALKKVIIGLVKMGHYILPHFGKIHPEVIQKEREILDALGLHPVK
jgi:hypothetical protein